MTEHDDFEDELKRFHHETDPRVKRSVMEAYGNRLGRGRLGPGRVPLWKRTIPIYAVAALLAIAVGVTWTLGRARIGDRAGATAARNAPGDTALVWATAERDQI